MTSPFVFDVTEMVGAQAGDAPERRKQEGPAPERIGAEMIAIPEGADVTVDATLTPLGSGILVDADVQAPLEGECSRCLKPLKRDLDIHVSQAFATDDDFVSGDPEDEDDEGSGDEVPEVKDNRIDLLQTVTDEVGLNLPFAPTCEGGCDEEDLKTPKGVSTGVSGEENEDRIDPRWSGLEKFL